MTNVMVYGSIEAGGTKFVCMVGSDPQNVLSQTKFPTGKPEATIAEAIRFFEPYADQLQAVGIACFGPLDIGSGMIASTPKPGWQHRDVVGPFRDRFGVPVGFDTDVNGALLGEYRWGAGQGLEDLVYLTLGTGIGGGALVNGKLVHGHMHPEMGHVLISRLAGDATPSVCPYHEDCWEGLASGKALAQRAGKSGEELSAEDPAWQYLSRYLAMGLMSTICMFSPRKIIAGGGLSQRVELMDRVRVRLAELINDYLALPPLEEYVVSPQLGQIAGAMGGFVLAENALQQSR